jgi:hypothetical protein
MTTWPSWAAGDLISAELLAGGQANMIVKQSNQDVVDSTAFVDDNELVVPLEGSGGYTLIWCLAVGATQTNSGGAHFCQINTEYTWPANATGFKYALGPRDPGDATNDRENTAMVSAVHNPGTDRRYGTISLTSAAAVIEHHNIVTVDAGYATLRFALGNNPAGTGDTARILAGSFVVWWRAA